MYHLRRLSALVLSLAIAPLLFLPTPAAAANEDSMPLVLSSASALLMEKETGTVLLQQNAHQKLEPASVTKIMTLLLVMEAVDSGRLSLDELVPVSAHAAGMGGSQVYLKEGEQLSVSDLIKCVAVVSGNDCAVALAERLAGSESAFVDQMNQKAQSLGMADTHFVNCTGLPAPGHLTSAWDIALMSRELILRHPDIQQYTTIWTDSIRNGAFGLTNTNRLVRFYDGATGLKTGFTASAQYCMSATAQRNGMELIAVVMKAPTTAQRFQDASSLLDYGFANYALITPSPKAPWPRWTCSWAGARPSSPSSSGSVTCWWKRPRPIRSPPASIWPRTSRPRWTPARPWGSSRSMLEMSCGTPSPSSPPRGWTGSPSPACSPNFCAVCSSPVEASKKRR